MGRKKKGHDDDDDDGVVAPHSCWGDCGGGEGGYISHDLKGVKAHIFHLGPQSDRKILRNKRPMSPYTYMEVSLNYCSQNGGNVYRAPYYNRNLNI